MQNYCLGCGFLGQGAPSLTGHVECHGPTRYARNKTRTHPLDEACEDFAHPRSLEGAIGRLSAALTHLGLAYGMMGGWNVGTVYDPRVDTTPRCSEGHEGRKVKGVVRWPKCDHNCIPF